MSKAIDVRTLTDGGQQPLEIAHTVAELLCGVPVPAHKAGALPGGAGAG